MLEIYKALLKHDTVGTIFQNKAARIENRTGTYPQLFISGCGDPKWSWLLPHLKREKSGELKKWLLKFLEQNDCPAKLFDISVKHVGDEKYDVAIGFDAQQAHQMAGQELMKLGFAKSRVNSFVTRMKETPHLENAAEAVRIKTNRP